MKFIPREEQKKVLEYKGGTMGISAVPGAGKTATLSALAADLIESIVSSQNIDFLSEPDQEVLIVTFSNSAEMNFSARIASLLEERGLTPGIGYKVKTLHAMALDILRGHTSQLGIPEDFSILDETEAGFLLENAVAQWLNEDNRATFDYIVMPYLAQDTKDGFYQKDWKNDLKSIVDNVISQAKDYHVSPEQLLSFAENTDDEFGRTMLKAAAGIYAHYQELLRNYPAMDFADIMYNAYRLLKSDTDYLKYLQHRYLYILEDEAQDSSLIQEEIIRMLAAEHNNWVRVGDPNQAINETFTTSSPDFLKKFLDESDCKVDLKTAGRSQLAVLRQANKLIRFVNYCYPVPECRDALTAPYVYPTKPGDAQGNPPEDPSRIVFDDVLYSKFDYEVAAVCQKAVEHVQLHPNETTAILVPTNEAGKSFVDCLSASPVEVVEVLRSTKTARNTAGEITAVLQWLSSPLSSDKLKNLFCSLYNENKKGEFFLAEDDKSVITSILSSITEPEAFFYPENEEELEDIFSSWDCSELVAQTLFRFRYFLRRWLDSRFLPIDQLVLLIAQDLYSEQDDLSCAGQIGSILLHTFRMNPNYNLSDLANKAEDAAKYAKLSSGLHGDELDFNPNDYPGKIAVITYHKSKGLEWDQVFATSVNDYYFPDGFQNQYPFRKRMGKKYVRNNLDLQAEMLYALKCAAFPDVYENYQEGKGSSFTWIDFCKERIRLLYVGITRAKKGLYMSSSLQYGRNHPSQTFAYLKNDWNAPQLEEQA